MQGRGVTSRREFLRLSVLGAASGIVAACAPAAPPTATPAPARPAEPAKASAPTVAAAPAKSAEAVTLVWDTFRGVGTPWPDHIIGTFKQKFPNVTVQFRPLPTSQTDSYPKLYAMYAAGNIGDLYSFDQVDYEFYRAVPQGLVRAVDDFIASDKYDPGQFYKPFWELQKLNGKVWGLPSWGHPGDGGFVLNELSLQDAGLKVPDYKSADWTMQVFYELIVKLHKTSGGQIVRYGTNLGLAHRHMTTTTRAFMGDLISQDGKKAIVTEPNPTKGFRWVYDLAQKEKVVALPGGFQGSANDLFASGKLGSIQAGALAMFNVRLAIKDPSLCKMKTILYPKRPDGIYPSQIRAGTWQIGSKSKSPEWAWEFVKHKSSRDGVVSFNRMAQSAGAFVRPDILDDDYFADPNFEPYKDTLLTAMPFIVPANARGTELQDVFAQEHANIYLGRVPFEQGLKSLNDELQRVLDKPTT